MSGQGTEARAGGAFEAGADAGVSHIFLRAADAVIAVPAASALEIWHPEKSHPVPGTPHHVIGIASFRGAPVPLLDLAAALDLRAAGAKPRGARSALDDRRAVLTQAGPFLVGLVVDGTLGVLDITAAETRLPTVVNAGRLLDFATGELDTPRWGVAAVLDLEAFLEAVRVRS